MVPQSLCSISEVAPKHTHTHLKSRATVSKFEKAHAARRFLGGASMQNLFQLKYDSQLFSACCVAVLFTDYLGALLLLLPLLLHAFETT